MRIGHTAPYIKDAARIEIGFKSFVDRFALRILPVTSGHCRTAGEDDDIFPFGKLFGNVNDFFDLLRVIGTPDNGDNSWDGSQNDGSSHLSDFHVLDGASSHADIEGVPGCSRLHDCDDGNAFGTLLLAFAAANAFGKKVGHTFEFAFPHIRCGC